MGRGRKWAVHNQLEQCCLIPVVGRGRRSGGGPPPRRRPVQQPARIQKKEAGTSKCTGSAVLRWGLHRVPASEAPLAAVGGVFIVQRPAMMGLSRPVAKLPRYRVAELPVPRRAWYGIQHGAGRKRPGDPSAQRDVEQRRRGGTRAGRAARAMSGRLIVHEHSARQLQKTAWNADLESVAFSSSLGKRSRPAAVMRGPGR
mmetsp:Transcript_19613/g.60598  ORF Transcript_19613/g.60598 Transcript_19613/m.60598 type:complete len:200 (+) Transcript_19613:684-1283(+)